MALPLLTGGNVLYRLDPTIGLVYFVAVTVAFLALLFRHAAPANVPPSATACYALGGFIVWWIGQVALRPSGDRAWFDAVGMGIAATFYISLSVRRLSQGQTEWLAVGLLVGTLGTTIYGQYQYWVIQPRIAAIFESIYGRPPIASLNANFYNANCYAPFLAAVLLLTPALGRSQNVAVRRFSLLAAVPVLLTLVFTNSRAAVALFLGAGLVLFGRRASPRARHALLGAAVIGAAGVLWVQPAWIDPAELWSHAWLGRVAMWKAAVAMISDHWLLGVGVGRFGELFPVYQLTDYYTRYPHNLLLEIAAETGIVGLAAISTFFVAAFLAASRGFRRGGLGAGMFLAACVLLAHALLDIDWHAPANAILLMILLSISSRTGSGEVE